MQFFFQKKNWLIVFLFFGSSFLSYRFFVAQYQTALLTKNSTLIENQPAELTTAAEKITAEYGEFAELTIPVIKTIPLDRSPLKIEETVAKKSNYTEYRASYLAEGYRIYGLLTIPDGAQLSSTPAVIFIHGYIPPQIYKTNQRYLDYVDYLASSGLIVFKLDLRGHDQSEGEAAGAYFSNDYVLDVLNAVESIKTLPEVAAEKISLWGHSMAGNIVARSIAVNPNIKAGVIWAGAVYSYSDMREYGINDSSFRREDLPREHQPSRADLFAKVGELDSGSKFWQLVSPISWLKNYPGEIQLHHAVDDQTVSIAYSRNLVALLQDSSVNLKLFEYPSGGHDLEGSVFNQAMARSVEAFTR
ncbi:MAG: alpha/beta hydrolase family protein [Patescibacteria group bacterium]